MHKILLLGSIKELQFRSVRLGMGSMNLRTKLILILAGCGALLMVSCETFAGMGRDIQRAGQGMENSGQGREW